LNLNAQNGDAAGTHLRFNDPIGGALEFALPTTGFQNIVVKFATRRSGSGPDNQLWSYSLDGTNYVSFATINPFNGDPTLQTLDFTAITGADNNPDFKLKVAFEQGAGGTAGNNRFDNYTLTGNPIGGDVTAPIALIAPADASINVAIDTNPSITFNEDIRLANNDAITDANVDAVVEVRLNSASGALVPFDATFAANTITINPTADLANNQVYYVALLPNAVEDLSDNAITTTESVTFTTIAVQNDFNAGDMAFVAYRMSATGAEDEIAFVTFVNIPDGTTFNLTDAKYTTNAQPQCAGGIVWTAEGNTCIPAGTVITIRTNVLTANIGTVTGSGFGLSSGGDQVAIYTGTAAAPNYITAMSSNGWIATNTDCGGSLSMLAAGLTDGTTSLNTSTAPGNVSGNTANAFYNGTNDGEPSALKALILDPANWTTSPSNTAPQTWPTWAFPISVKVQSVAILNNTTIEITFTDNLNVASASNVANYTGIAGLTSAVVSGSVVTLTYSTPFLAATMYSLEISNIEDANNVSMACAYDFTFDGTLATTGFAKNASAFVMYPNPTGNGIVHFNRTATVQIFDFTGKLMQTANEAKTIDTAAFAKGLYLVRTSEGITQKLLVK
ncbi:MAG TPA: Ig-like domain-containing protein, partial [Flavobacterium sp.]|nr:Ig-like domain-containing protein [Flavobacterium sp.]